MDGRNEDFKNRISQRISYISISLYLLGFLPFKTTALKDSLLEVRGDI